jgi:lysophospholipase L1-like esterase
MRSQTFFAALIVVIAGVALVAVRYGTDARTAEPPGTATLVGDSLKVGLERYIADTLPRWRILANDQVGRTTSEGIAELVAGRAALSPYLVVSLGTNDAHDVDAFRASVARVLKLAGPDRCVVWATIWRDGRPSDDFNDVLREAAEANKRLRLVAWAEMVEQRPELLASDGLHGNETGYRERARCR